MMNPSSSTFDASLAETAAAKGEVLSAGTCPNAEAAASATIELIDLGGSIGRGSCKVARAGTASSGGYIDSAGALTGSAGVCATSGTLTSIVLGLRPRLPFTGAAAGAADSTAPEVPIGAP